MGKPVRTKTSRPPQTFSRSGSLSIIAGTFFSQVILFHPPVSSEQPALPVTTPHVPAGPTTETSKQCGSRSGPLRRYRGECERSHVGRRNAVRRPSDVLRQKCSIVPSPSGFGRKKLFSPPVSGRACNRFGPSGSFFSPNDPSAAATLSRSSSVREVACLLMNFAPFPNAIKCGAASSETGPPPIRSVSTRRTVLTDTKRAPNASTEVSMARRRTCVSSGCYTLAISKKSVNCR